MTNHDQCRKTSIPLNLNRWMEPCGEVGICECYNTAACWAGDQRCVPSQATQIYYVPNLSAARALALAASSSRFLGAALVSSELNRRTAQLVISSTAASNCASLAFDGFVNPLIFRTNCSEAARASASVTGGSKLNRVFILRHMAANPGDLSAKPQTRPVTIAYVFYQGSSGHCAAHGKR